MVLELQDDLQNDLQNRIRKGPPKTEIVVHFDRFGLPGGGLQRDGI